MVYYQLGASGSDSIGELLGSKSELDHKKLQAKAEPTEQHDSIQPPAKRKADECSELPGIRAGPVKVC